MFFFIHKINNQCSDFIIIITDVSSVNEVFSYPYFHLIFKQMFTSSSNAPRGPLGHNLLIFYHIFQQPLKFSFEKSYHIKRLAHMKWNCKDLKTQDLNLNILIPASARKPMMPVEKRVARRRDVYTMVYSKNPLYRKMICPMINIKTFLE